MTQFEDKFMEVQASMVSLAMEYVQNQAEKIYIYCISEEALQSYKVFYKINGVVIEMDKVNEVVAKKVDDSDNMTYAIATIAKVAYSYENKKELPSPLENIDDSLIENFIENLKEINFNFYDYVQDVKDFLSLGKSPSKEEALKELERIGLLQ